jgi:hypothetical protein
MALLQPTTSHAQAEESRKRSDRLIDSLRAILEETDLRIAGEARHPPLGPMWT